MDKEKFHAWSGTGISLSLVALCGLPLLPDNKPVLALAITMGIFILLSVIVTWVLYKHVDESRIYKLWPLFILVVSCFFAGYLDVVATYDLLGIKYLMISIALWIVAITWAFFSKEKKVGYHAMDERRRKMMGSVAALAAVIPSFLGIFFKVNGDIVMLFCLTFIALLLWAGTVKYLKIFIVSIKAPGAIDA